MDDEKQQQDTEPIQDNSFVRGMMLDIDKSKVPTDRYLIAKDIKIFNKKGQGLIITTADGNEFAFSITDGFIPTGVQQHKDILYIISCRIDGLGEGEIGCYPSPNSDGSGFDLVYSPLKNLTDSLYAGAMRSDVFSMNQDFRADIEIKDSYDGSVDIYFADGNNQLRVVNSGFKQDGSSNGRDYTLATLATTFNLVLGTETALKIDLDSVTTGGGLKYGNYIFFIQYSTEDFNTTHFVSESGPVPIFKGINTAGSIMGGSADGKSDKKIVLSLSNVDENYAYVKVGYIRHFSDYNAIPTYEIGMFSSRFKIESSAFTIEITGNEGEVLVTEEEFLVKKETEVIPQSIVQIKNRLYGANYKKTETFDESLADFAKLIKIGYTTAKKISNTIQTPSTSSLASQYKHYEHVNEYIGYFRGEAYPYAVVFEFIDSSLSEGYPMNGVDMWDNLTPDYDPSGADNGNYEGIFRFPNTKNESFLEPLWIKVLGVEFDTEDAFESIMAARENNWIRFNVKAIHFVRGERNKTLLYQGLMMAVSMPMGENAHYDMTKYCSYGNYEYFEDQNTYGGQYLYGPAALLGDMTAPSFSAHAFWGWSETGETNLGETDNIPIKYAPLWRGYVPMVYQDYIVSPPGKEVLNGCIRAFVKPDKYAFYSMDMLMQATNDIDNIGYVMRVGKTITARPGATTNNVGLWYEKWDTSNPKEFPRLYHAEFGTALGFIAVDSESASVSDKVVVGNNGTIRVTDSGHNDFINEVMDPWIDHANSWFMSNGVSDPDTNTWIWYNRGFVSAKYIGLDLSDHDFNVTLQNDDFNMDIVNLYPSDPSVMNILNMYPNRVSLKYFKISKPILIADVVKAIIDTFQETIPNWDEYKAITCYRGDCFLQKNFFKQSYWNGSGKLKINNDDESWDDHDETDTGVESTEAYNAHGMVIGIITENSINAALRSEVSSNSFYPAEEMQPFVRKMFNSDNVESFNMNQGYSQVLSSNAMIAYDELIPYRSQIYNTRIRYTDEHIPGSFIDGYRSFRQNNFVDFDSSNGNIIKIAEMYDALISVQEDAISEHYIDERVTNPGDQRTILGYGDVLSKQFRKIANFGSQHKWSIIESDSLYGIDWKRNIIWEVSLKRSQAGKLYVDAKDLTKEAFIEEWINDIFEEFSSGRSDKTNEYLDLTLKGEGIVSGEDVKYSDVYFTFHKRTEV